ncbi:SAV_915 family protein [Cellulomonas telluris]|uniref:SAV_915 family protein n=1 Tax=Cellulomonas telluris TaxID=2306636 RepID=UPI001CA44876|nr:SAV_915 family protein [Cellulomonas telluris]
MTRPLPADYPPILYIPCVREVADPADLEVEYRTTRDGRTALLVYSALDRLHAGAGPDQPWFTLPTSELQKLYDVRPFDLVLLDMLVPEEHRTVASA